MLPKQDLVQTHHHTQIGDLGQPQSANYGTFDKISWCGHPLGGANFGAKIWSLVQIHVRELKSNTHGNLRRDKTG